MILFPGTGLVAKMLTAVIFAFAGTLILFAFLQTRHTTVVVIDRTDRRYYAWRGRQCVLMLAFNLISCKKSVSGLQATSAVS